MESSKPRSAAVAELEKLSTDLASQNGSKFSGIDVVLPEAPTAMESSKNSIGYVDVFVHQARDIQNICIYHKQDVYAKLCLTSDPDSACSTKVINGGGRNPVFNDGVRLDVSTMECSLKCEIWMMSRVKNYMQDQLLGFALVPMADVAIADGKLDNEFPMSSTDLYHSPAGFVQLSISYVGSMPEVLPISPSVKPALVLPLDEVTDMDNNGDSIQCELERVEFPDLNVAQENKIMVSEYFGIPCSTLETKYPESLAAAENGDSPDDEAGMRVVESFSKKISLDNGNAFHNESPVSCVSTPESSTAATSDPSGVTVASPPSPKLVGEKVPDGEADSSERSDGTAAAVFKPLVSINIEQQQPDTVFQQDIIDMYTKSMKQFTESLANMKLPMDIENSSSPTSGAAESTAENKTPRSEGPASSRVFYGSRAFF